MEVGVLQEPGVHLHLAGQHRLEFLGHVVPGGDLRVTCGQFGVGRDHPQLLLPGEGALALDVPAVVEPTGVLVGPLLGDVVRGVGRAGSEVHEERLVGHQRLLLPHPAHCSIGEVLGEVVALLGSSRRIDRRGPVVEGGVVLVVLPTDEAVEGLETTAARGPGVERSQRRGLPHRHLVALSELGGGVAVELQGHRQRGLGVRPQRVVPRRRGRCLGDAPHPHRMVVPPRQQRLTSRRAQRRRVESVVSQTPSRQPVRGRGLTRPTERAGRTEPHVVEQHDQDVGRALGRTKRLDGREGSIRILRVVRRQPDRRTVGNRQHAAGMRIGAHVVSFGEGC